MNNHWRRARARAVLVTAAWQRTYGNVNTERFCGAMALGRDALAVGGVALPGKVEQAS